MKKLLWIGVALALVGCSGGSTEDAGQGSRRAGPTAEPRGVRAERASEGRGPAQEVAARAERAAATEPRPKRAPAAGRPRSEGGEPAEAAPGSSVRGAGPQPLAEGSNQQQSRGGGPASRWRRTSARGVVRLHGPLGLYTETRYDEQGRVVAKVPLDGRERTIRYDESGFPTEAQLPRGAARFEHSAKREAVITPAGRVWAVEITGQASYATEGPHGRNETRRLDERTVELRDASGRVFRFFDSPGERTTTDRSGRRRARYFEHGRLRVATIEQGDQVVDYLLDDYDDQGRLTRVRTPVADLRFQHTSRSRRRTTPWGVTERVHDAQGRLLRVETADGAFTFTYDERGRRRTLTYPNGVVVRYRHDALNRRVAAQSSVLEVSSTYNRRHERQSVTRDGETTRYGYDVGGALASETREGRTVRYAYGPDGDRLAKLAADGQRTSYRYDRRGRLTRAGDVDLRYDPSGRLIARGDDRFVYDDLGRLCEVRRAGRPTVRYTYDPLARLATRAVGDRVTRYVHDGGQVVAEVGPGQRVRTYVYGAADEPLAYCEDGVWTFLHTDLLDNVVAYSDAQGERTAAARFDAFGATQPSALGRPRFFQGRPVDPVTGLVHFRARWYDPGLGRFLRADPSGMRGGFNAYAFCEGDPVNQRDPRGLYPESDLGYADRQQLPLVDYTYPSLQRAERHYALVAEDDGGSQTPRHVRRAVETIAGSGAARLWDALTQNGLAKLLEGAVDRAYELVTTPYRLAVEIGDRLLRAQEAGGKPAMFKEADRIARCVLEAASAESLLGSGKDYVEGLVETLVAFADEAAAGDIRPETLRDLAKYVVEGATLTQPHTALFRLVTSTLQRGLEIADERERHEQRRRRREHRALVDRLRSDRIRRVVAVPGEARDARRGRTRRASRRPSAPRGGARSARRRGASDALRDLAKTLEGAGR